MIREHLNSDRQTHRRSKLAQAIKEDTDATRNHIVTLKSRVELLRQDTDLEHHEKLISWLSPIDFPSQQSDIMHRRQEGTGQWFLDSTEFVTWRSQPKAELFCPGIPGAGKTMIAAIAIDELLRTIHDDGVGIAYVYCDYKSQEEQNATSLMATILKQLLQAQPSLSEPLQTLHQKHAGRGTRPSLDDIFTSLRAVLSGYTTVFLVVDALDECQESDGSRRQFLTRIRDLGAELDFRLLITSRFIPEIVDEFKEIPRLEIKASHEDVRRFVHGQMHRLPRCIQRDSALQEKVQDKVVEAVDGMFLLAKLHTDSLLDKRTPRDVKYTLETFSGGSAALESAYEDAIVRIKGQLSGDYKLARKVLSWITYAKRPITTAEVCCALAVEQGDTELDVEKIPDVEDLLAVCAGLVVVDEETTIIRLVHYTTQEYFERIRNGWNPRAELDIATTCLTYLSFTTFYSSPEYDRRDTTWLEQNAFLGYAAQYWGQHALKHQDELYELAYPFLMNGALIDSATKAVSLLRQAYVALGRTGLHLTAQFGLRNFSAKLLSQHVEPQEISIDAKDSLDHTALSLAARHGHKDVIELLLDYGASDWPSKLYGNALQTTSYFGHEEAVRLLLDRGADVNAEGTHYGGALHEAAHNGHERIVKMLLKSGADVNAECLEYGSPLQAASSNGHEEVVKLLLSEGADINAQGGRLGTSLQIAARRGYELLFSFLLAEGADIHAGSGNALLSASAWGNERIVKLLLEVGADLNARTGGTTALQVAAYNGRDHVVALLLDSGADINAQDGEFGTALQAACYRGYEVVVRLLVDKGADINATGGYHGTPLASTFSRGKCSAHRKRIAELLLAQGVDINAPVDVFGNVLQAASFFGHDEVAKFLLEKGADVGSYGGYYGSFLNTVAYLGNLHLLRHVYELYNTSLDLTDFHGRTPLHLAALGGREETFDYLLDLGLDPSAEDALGYDLLCYAASSGSLHIVETVLRHKHSFSTGVGSWTSLHWACRKGNPEIVEKLIISGVHSELVSLSHPEGKWSPTSVAIFHGNDRMLQELSLSSRSSLSISGEISVKGAVKHVSDGSGAFECNACNYVSCFHEH